MKEQLQAQILKYYPNFDRDALEEGMALFERKEIRSKEIVMKAGEVSNELYFAKASISRCFYHDEEGAEQTLWMKPEQTFITEFKSFVHQEASRFNIQFYEDTEAYCISRQSLLELYSSNKDWAQFGVFLTEHLHIILIDVFVNLLANDATRNYQYIEYMFPRFIQVAPLKDIASMLQMSPVSLSRIRAGKQSKK